jgi:insulysin
VRYFKLLGLLVIAFQLSACGLLDASWDDASEKAAVSVLKPVSDQRQYRYTELGNGLKVVLISDAGADKAAASLDVNVGSRQDPQNYQGLAHFLEHMLFLGTEKYPVAGAYQEFITAHGGSHNAFTSFEHTNYFFDISADSLEPALDQFAQFFVAPLFNAEYVQREVNAVNSEYRARIRDDQRRELAVFKAQVNQAHPFAKFSVGNLDTLHSTDEVALREQLLAFYRKNYSSNIMTLTVIGKESLDELEALVVPKFADVVNRSRYLAPITVPLFNAGDLPRWVNIQPVQNRRSLSINFPVPDAEKYWHSKPLNYIGNILGHEGAGSLLSVLKARGWVDSLSAGQSFDYQGGALFGVDVALTESGLKHVDDIVGLVYQSIAQLRSNGIDAWRFDEQAGLANQQFMFRAQPAAINEVVQLSMGLQRYPARELLRGPYLMDQYTPELLGEFLAAMTPENSFISLVAPDVKVDIEIPRYQVAYGERKVSAEQLAALASENTAELTLPVKNNFIASDFSLKKGDGSAIPKLISSSPIELWLSTDDVFELPKGRVYLLLESEDVVADADRRAESDLWLRMVKDQLNELAYPAQLAGLDFDVSVGWRGIQISIGGYNQKQGELLRKLLTVLKNPEWQESRFARLKAQRLRQFENTRRQSPYQQVVAELPRLLNRENPGLDAYEAATKAADLASVAAHVETVMKDLRLRMLVDGNFSEDDAKSLANVVTSTLPLSAESRTSAQFITHLPTGTALRKIAAEHDDSAVLLYLQSAAKGMQARVAMGLTAQMLSADFYHKLRTEKQLGYVVSASVYPQREVAGLIFLVQSPVLDPASVQSEINGYIEQWLKTGIDEAGFEKHKAGLLLRLAEQPENLWDAADRHWQDLLDNYPKFDSRERLVSALQGLTYAEWLTATRRDLGVEQRAMLVYNSGKWPQSVPKGKPIGEPEIYKANLPAYQFK